MVKKVKVQQKEVEEREVKPPLLIDAPRKHVADTLLATVKVTKFSLLKAGQRSGKTTILEYIARVAEDQGYDNIIYVPRSYEEGRRVTEGWYDSVDVITLPDLNPGDNVHPGSLLLVDDLFLNASANILLHDYLSTQYCQVIAASSNGPEFERNASWRQLPGYSYSTWDLNYRVSRESLAVQYARNPVLAKHYFEAF